MSRRFASIRDEDKPIVGGVYAVRQRVATVGTNYLSVILREIKSFMAVNSPSSSTNKKSYYGLFVVEALEGWPTYKGLAETLYDPDI